MKVSIITVCFNSAKDLIKTHENLASIDTSFVEWIVIDNMSTDNTFELVKTFKFKPTFFIHERDSGIYDAMNKGINLANSDYIIFLNAGDRIYAKNWPIVKDCLCHSLTKESDVVMFDCNYVNGKKIIYKKKSIAINQAVTHGMPACHQSIFFNTTSLQSIKYSLRYKLCGDYEIIAEFFKQNKKFENINLISSIFEVGGVSSKNLKLLFLEPYLIQRNILKLNKIARFASLARRTISTIVYLVALNLFK